jgi:hypothetical protein
MEIMDITYVVPPLVVAVGAPLTEADRVAGKAHRLFTLAVPKMYKRTTNPSVTVAVSAQQTTYPPTYLTTHGHKAA